MSRVVFLIFLASICLFSKERVELFAKRVIVKDNTTVEASGDVLVLYDNSIIKVDKALFDKKKSTLKLLGDVEMIGKKENRLYSNSLTINLKDKDIYINNIFLGSEDNLWIDAKSAKKVGNHYKLTDSRVSSCNRSNPDWTIEFKKADYYEDREFLIMKDAKVRFYNTTIFYLPYLAFPTVHKRTTGLLYPRFKYTNRDGFVYEQSYFYAKEPNWDIELTPQFRLKRGIGAYVTLRFVDSNHSRGFFRTGYFKNKDSYATSNNLNSSHQGFEIFYSSSNILPTGVLPKEYRSGFYLNGIYLNDREYLNLQKDKISSYVSSNLIESRLNAFVYNSKNYIGVYGKYNIDVSQDSNERTIQELPSIHYHRYLQRIYKNLLFYTLDTKVNNYTRTKGSTATQVELDLPITFSTSFFNNYLDFSASENLYLTRVDFRNINPKYTNYYYYYRNYHKITLSSDLVKRYQNFTHVLNPNITYIIPSSQKEEPLEYNYLATEKKELFTTYTEEEQISVGFKQYFFNRLISNFSHSFWYSHYPKREKSQGDIINEIEYKRGNINIYNNLKYALEERELHSLTTSLTYNKSNYDIMLTHFYNNDLLFNNKKTSFLQSRVDYKIDKEDTYIVKFDYNLEKGYNHEWSLGWQHRQKCWSGKVSIGQEIVPNRDSSFKNTALYVELNLYPIGGIKQNFEEDFSSQGDRK